MVAGQCIGGPFCDMNRCCRHGSSGRPPAGPPSCRIKHYQLTYALELLHSLASQQPCACFMQDRSNPGNVTHDLLTTGTTGLPPLSLPLPSCNCCPFTTTAPGAAGSNSAVAAGAALEPPGPCCLFCSDLGRKPPALRPAVGLKAGIAAAEKGLAGPCAASLQASVKHVPRLARGETPQRCTAAASAAAA